VVSVCPKPNDISRWVDDNMPGYRSNIDYIAFRSSSHEKFHSQNNKKSPSIKLRFLSLLQRLRIRDFIKNIYSFGFSLLLWKKTNDIIATYLREKSLQDPVMVFFPYLDCSYFHKFLFPAFLDRIFHYQWGGLYLQPTHIRMNQNLKFRYPDFMFFSLNCKVVSVLDENIIDKFQKKIKKPVIFFPDITDSKSATVSAHCQDILKLAGGKKIISSIGTQAKKKNLTMLLKIAEYSSRQNLPYFFVIAGGPVYWNTWNKKEQDYIKSLYESKNDNIYFYFQVIPDGPEYNSFIKISDLIFAVYHNFYHSSNTLTKAAIFEKPVIVDDRYLMAERVIKYQTGLAVPEGNMKKTIQAIDCLLRKVDYNELSLNPKFKEYEEIHAQKYLCTAFEQVIKNYHID
jgi:glycosyltransferase involved in cell wall biosynthesis